jgi:hypothetical protein
MLHKHEEAAIVLKNEVIGLPEHDFYAITDNECYLKLIACSLVGHQGCLTN